MTNKTYSQIPIAWGMLDLTHYSVNIVDLNCLKRLGLSERKTHTLYLLQIIDTKR